MRYFTENHEWVEEIDGFAVVGITTYAADELGDITFIELPELETNVVKSNTLAVIESVKAASEIYAPINGTVAEVNTDVETEPEKINESPEENGWICKLSDFKKEDFNDLMSEEEYLKLI